jgi:uncharacterized membrane protein
MEKEKITFHDIFYIFLFGCLFGWIVEGIWSYLKRGILLNHSALVLGPFNVVYGVSAIVLTLCLYRLKDKKYIQVFGISFAVGTVLEYIMSFLMEKTLGFVAWNYSKKPFNINGRVCLTYSIFWGILGLIWIKLIYPRVKKIIDKFNKRISNKFMIAMIVFLIFNTLLTFAAVERGKEFEQGIPPSNKFERILDKYFGVEYLNNMYNNRWNKK